jgi:type IV secretory pathway VirJ component
MSFAGRCAAVLMVGATSILGASAGPPSRESSRTPESTTPSADSAGTPSPTPHRHDAGYTEDSITIPTFGKVKVYRPEPVERARGVALFVSGDGGWNLGVVDMARRVATQAIIVGLSMPIWQKAVEKDPNHCWYPAGELEQIAQGVEKVYKLPRYVKPILIGYSSGATVVYGVLAQAPADAFAGAVSLGFCPDIEVARPICSQSDWKPSYDPKKKRSLLPPRAGLAPRADGTPRWTALQGLVDRVCDPNDTVRFVADVPSSHVAELPKVGHGFSAPRNWGSTFDGAVGALLEPAPVWGPIPTAARHVVTNRSPRQIEDSLEALDLPLEVQWPDGAREALIFVSGDGGWAELDQRVASGLAERGVAVIGWNTLRYFWAPKTAEGFRADITRLVGALPSDERIYVGGYSFGAEVTAVTLGPRAEAPPGLLSRIAGLVLVGPGPYATFEVSPLDWFRTSTARTQHSVAAALESAAGSPVLCLQSSEHGDSGCPEKEVAGLRRVVVPGGHHFGGDFDALAGKILEFIEATREGGAKAEPAGAAAGN